MLEEDSFIGTDIFQYFDNFSYEKLRGAGNNNNIVSRTQLLVRPAEGLLMGGGCNLPEYNRIDGGNMRK